MTYRVAIVAHHALGGSGVMAVEWARLLAERGHRVELIRTGGSRRDEAALSVVDPDRLSVHLVAPPAYPVLDGPSHLTAVASTVLRLHAERAIDVLHVHYALPFALIVPVVRSVVDAPACVVSLHGSDVTGVGGAPEYQPALRASIEAADAVTVPSAWLGDQAADVHGLRRDRVVRLPNFVPLDRFHPGEGDGGRSRVVDAFGDDPGAPIVVHVSNFRAVKRAKDAVDIVAALRARRPARLVLVGDGPELRSLAAYGQERLGDAFVAVGAVDDPAPWLREADALLLPSATESFGLVALESLACGTPVVASEIGGLAEWLDGEESARLCPVGDIDAFASALHETLTSHGSPGERQSSARSAAERIGSPHAAAEVLERIYHAVAPGRAGANPQRTPKIATES